MFGNSSQPQHQRMGRRTTSTTTTSTTSTTKTSVIAHQNFQSCSQSDHLGFVHSPFPAKQSDVYDDSLTPSMSVISHPSASTSSQFVGEHFPMMRHPLDMPHQFPLVRCDSTKVDFDYARHHQQHFPQFFDCLSCPNPQSMSEGYYSSIPPTLLPQEVEFDLRHRGEISQFSMPHNSGSPVEDYPYYIDFNLVPQGHDLSNLQSSDLETKHDGKEDYLGFQSGLDSTSTSTSESSSGQVAGQIKTENSAADKGRQEGKAARGLPNKRKTNLQDSIRKHRRREQNRIAARKCREKKKVQVDSILKGYQRTLKENERLQKEVEELHSVNSKLSGVINGHKKVCPLLQSSDIVSVLRIQGVSNSSPVSTSRGSPPCHGVSGFAEPFCDYPPASQNNPGPPRNVFYQP